MRYVVLVALIAGCAATNNNPPTANVAQQREIAARGQDPDQAARTRQATFGILSGAFSAGARAQQPPPSPPAQNPYYSTSPAPASVYDPQPARAPAAAPAGCFSDYSCGVGFKCVKQGYATNGTCMRAVDANGVPTYSPPGGAAPAKCNFVTDCPVGFRCTGYNGVCVK